jgi:hypothetical protein
MFSIFLLSDVASITLREDGQGSVGDLVLWRFVSQAPNAGTLKCDHILQDTHDYR